jgi:DNA (cytosine-5)-methyltransferase 1
MNELVLSLFPGLNLLGKAFEEEGFCVVRGPDLLWGGDVKRFHPPARTFAGVIGGPPCQIFSQSQNITGVAKARVDLIPEYIRVIREAQPDFVVMENVCQALGHGDVPPEWFPAVLRDFDCGGETNRTRAFWTWPFMLLAPGRRSGKASLSVMASTAKRGRTSAYANDKRFLPGDLPIEEYERLQGWPGITAEFTKAGASKRLAVHLLGNGVPRALGRTVAQAARKFCDHPLP